jgi:hypothetical protein
MDLWNLKMKETQKTLLHWMATESKVALLLLSFLARRGSEGMIETEDMTEIVVMTETEATVVTEVMTGTVIEVTAEEEETVVVVEEVHLDSVLLATLTIVSLSKISHQAPAGRTSRITSEQSEMFALPM